MAGQRPSCGAETQREWAQILTGLQSNGKLRQKIEQDFILWRQKWLMVEMKDFQKELPLPTSQWSPVQPAWHRHFPESWSHTPWWQLQFCSQPSPNCPSPHSEMGWGRMMEAQAGATPAGTPSCLCSVMSHLNRA